MHRRDLLKLGASFAATLAAVPVVWGQEAAKQAAKPGWRPSVLSAHENESTIAITEIIIPATDTPGAKAAHVNRYIDLLLRDGPLDQREQFIGGLAWLDGYAIREHGHAFVKCSLRGSNRDVESSGRRNRSGAHVLSPGEVAHFENLLRH